MAKRSVTFELGGGYWVAERQSVGFEGLTALGPVEFLVRACRERYAVVATAPEVERLRVRLERPHAVWRRRRLVRGNQLLVDDDALHSTHPHDGPREIIGRARERRRTAFPAYQAFSSLRAG